MPNDAVAENERERERELEARDRVSEGEQRAHSETTDVTDRRTTATVERQRIEESTPVSKVDMRTENGVTLGFDERGNITKVVSAKGTTDTFEYDTKGNVIGRTGPDGNWKTEDGKHWTSDTGSVFEGSVRVGKDGSWNLSDVNGSHQIKPDGSDTYYKADGSVVSGTRDSITRVVDANNVSREFGYDSNGQINKFKDQSGTWTTKDGTNWTNEKNESWRGQVAVRDDGTFVSFDAKGITVHQTDGKTIVQHKGGGAHQVDESGRISATIDAKNERTQFGYGPDGKINSVDENGTKWETRDGKHWTNKEGKTREGTASIDKDGNYKFVDRDGNETIKNVDGTKQVKETSGRETLEDRNGKVTEIHKAVDRHAMEMTAEAIHKATGYENWVARWADKDKINELLNDKTEAERKVIDQEYRRKYGKGLEEDMRFLSGNDREKFLNILYKKDNDVASQDAGHIRENLSELNNWVQGRSSKVIEKDIRDTLAKHNSEDLARMDKEYKEKYGVGLGDAIRSDKNLSQSTKDMAAVLLKGNDKITDADTLKLANIAMKDQDIDKFAEAFRDASPQARKMFKEQGGEQKMQDAFGGHWYNAAKFTDLPGWAMGRYGNVTDKELTHAKDFLESGEISVKNQISDNTGVIGWTTNTKAIESAISGMSDRDRQNYMYGKAVAEGRDPGVNPSPAEREVAIKYYNDTHSAIVAAGNASEVSKWEDQIALKGGGLASDIASHRGWLYNDARGEVFKEIEGMNQREWEYAKKHPEYRADVEKSLRSLHGMRLSEDDIGKAMSMYDAKFKADTFEEAQKVGNRDIATAAEDGSHWYGNDRRNIVESISRMTPEEQKKYRENTDGYADLVNKRLEETLKAGPGLDAARHLLDKVSHGQAPEMDLTTKIGIRAQEKADSDFKATVAAGAMSPISLFAGSDNISAAKDKVFGSYTGDVIRDIKEEFGKDPALRDRILHPANDAEARQSQEFYKALQQSMSAADYKRYAEPLVNEGRLDIDKALELDRTLFNDDEQQVFKDLGNATPEEKQKLLSDKDYQDKALSFLGAEDRKIALAALEQKDGMRPEDVMRAHINHWGGSSEILKSLASVKPEELDQMQREYSRKYGSDLQSDLIGKLGGEDKVKAKRMLDGKLSPDEQFNEARQEYYRSRDGIGSWLTENIGNSATGYQADNAILKYQREINATNSQFDKITSEQTKQVQEAFRTALDDFKESKATAADAVVNGTIAAGAIGSLVVSGGLSTPLVVGVAMGGAAVKVGAKAAIMGADYDATVGRVSMDALVGAVDGVTAVIGPGEIAAIFKVGEKAGVEAAEITLKQLTEQGVQKALREGAEQALVKGTKEVMRESLASGAKKINEEALEKLAEQAVRPVGEGFTKEARDKAVEELANSLKKNLTQSFANETTNWLVNLGRETALNSGAGAMGGGTAGFAESVSYWDPTKSFDENMRNVTRATVMSAATGGALAGGATLGIRGAASAYDRLKGLTREVPTNLDTNLHTEPKPEVKPEVKPEPFEKPVISERPAPNENFELPPLKISDDGISIKADIPGYPKSHFRAEIPEPGVLNVTDIFARDLPQGQGSKFLAEAMKEHGKLPTKELVFAGILNDETLAAYRAGKLPEDSLLGKTGTKALKELGITPKGYEWKIVKGKLNLIIHTD